MPVISITSDWNRGDYYIGALKGKLLSEDPKATIVDLTHQIKTFNIAQAAFTLRNAYKHFPKGSIHLICINTEPMKDQKYVAVHIDGHFFIGLDNGIFSLMFKEEPQKIIELKNTPSSTFPALDILSPAAAYLSKGNPISELGSPLNEFRKQIPLRATIEESVINGSIIYIDSYKNAITNISRDLFEKIRNDRNFKIYIQSNHYSVDKINNTYSETSIGELLAIFNTLDLLEIAINKGNAAELLGLDVNAAVRVKFEDK